MRLIASDLDGTLFDERSTLASETIDALRRASASGIVIVAATGRSHRSALPRLAPAAVVDWAVCSNGATVYDVRNDRIHRHHPIADDQTAEVIARFRSALPDVGIAWETTDGLGFDRRFSSLRPRSEEMGPHWDRGASPDDHRPRAALKLLIAHPDLTGHDLRAELEPALPDRVTLSNSGASFVEVTGDGVDKAFALSNLCAELQVHRSDVVAFGDQHNDISMLRWAGRGIAVDNAHPDAVAAADHRTASHADHGVARAIGRLLSGSADPLS